MRRSPELHPATGRTEGRAPAGQYPLRILNFHLHPPGANERSATSTSVPPLVSGGPELSLGIPPEVGPGREGAIESLETINVLTDSLMAAGTDAAWGDRRPRFEVVAWVRNVDDRREVWVDLYIDGDRQPRPQWLVLDYFAPAGGGGDLFRLNLAFPPEQPEIAQHGVKGVSYRLYGRIGEALFTDGILHRHHITASDCS